MHVNPPEVDIVHSAYAKAFEFEPGDFATGGISPIPEFPPIWLTAQGGLTLRFAPNF